jgi:hypothetical protein
MTCRGWEMQTFSADIRCKLEAATLNYRRENVFGPFGTSIKIVQISCSLGQKAFDVSHPRGAPRLVSSSTGALCTLDSLVVKAICRDTFTCIVSRVSLQYDPFVNLRRMWICSCP